MAIRHRSRQRVSTSVFLQLVLAIASGLIVVWLSERTFPWRGDSSQPPPTLWYVVYPFDSASIEAFARATSTMREAVLAMVDARPPITPGPQTESRAMADLAAEKGLAESNGWGLEPVIDCFMFGGLQVISACESAASIALLYGSPRSFIATPYVALRVLAESGGRAKWIFEPGISTEARVIRAQNLRMEDLSARKKMFPWERSDIDKRIHRIRDGAQRRGLRLTTRMGYWNLRYIEDLPPRSTPLIKRGFGGFADSELGRVLSGLTSGMVHGSSFAWLSHASDTEAVDRGGIRHIPLGSSSERANMILAAAGLALRDAINAEHNYRGIESEEWSAAVAKLMKAGRQVIGHTLIGSR